MFIPKKLSVVSFFKHFHKFKQIVQGLYTIKIMMLQKSMQFKFVSYSKARKIKNKIIQTDDINFKICIQIHISNNHLWKF